VNIWRTVFVITMITSAAIGNGPQEVPSKRSGIDLELADYAKLICSAVFVSGRELEEAKLNSGPLVTSNSGASYSQLSEVDRITNTEVSVDRKQKLVRVRLRDSTRTARFFDPMTTRRFAFRVNQAEIVLALRAGEGNVFGGTCNAAASGQRCLSMDSSQRPSRVKMCDGMWSA
jgi:hypothetical protein